MKHIQLSCHIDAVSIDELNETDRSLIEKAKEAALAAYAPYSQFKVGAAVRLDNGETVIGNNQENASYPCGICAERTALYSAKAQYPHSTIEALAISAYTKDAFTPSPCPPCGLCRQAILECENQQGKKSIRILLYGTHECYIISGGAQSLLPLQFDENICNI